MKWTEDGCCSTVENKRIETGNLSHFESEQNCELDACAASNFRRRARKPFLAAKMAASKITRAELSGGQGGTKTSCRNGKPQEIALAPCGICVSPLRLKLRFCFVVSDLHQMCLLSKWDWEMRTKIAFRNQFVPAFLDSQICVILRFCVELNGSNLVGVWQL